MVSKCADIRAVFINPLGALSMPSYLPLNGRPSALPTLFGSTERTGISRFKALIIFRRDWGCFDPLNNEI